MKQQQVSRAIRKQAAPMQLSTNQTAVVAQKSFQQLPEVAMAFSLRLAAMG